MTPNNILFLFICGAITSTVAQQDTAAVVHDINSQSRCGLLYGSVSIDCRWESGLSFDVDQKVLGGKYVLQFWKGI